MILIFIALLSLASILGLPIFNFGLSRTAQHEYFVNDMPVESYAGQIPIIRNGDATEQSMFFW